MPGRAGRMLLRAARAARGLAGRGREVSGDGAGLQPGGGAWGDPRGSGVGEGGAGGVAAMGNLGVGMTVWEAALGFYGL